MRRMNHKTDDTVDLGIPIEIAALRLHEACNQMATIRAYSELAQSLVQDNEDVQQYMKGLKQKVDELEDLLRGIFRESPADPSINSKENLKIGEALLSTIERLRPRMQAREVQANISVLPPTSELLDPQTSHLLKHIFHCILDNAIDVSPNNGKIFIESSHDEGRGQTSITIRDQGPGIPDEIKTEIFKPFFTTKERGTGLGLFLARKILEEQLNGTLIIRSKHGSGSSFTITVPSRFLFEDGSNT